ncbi:MAG: hypothetical protein JXR94_02050 [Candidatus Hydrogenedentes bacterium]|nr:hypothetical protein [Candidatus Hydrogenedentota bacterium]
MRESIITKMTIGVMGLVLLAGCGMLGGEKGPSPEDLINAALDDFRAGIETKDVDKLMSCISEDFNHYEWGGKANLRLFIEDVMSQGNLDNGEIGVEQAEIEFDGDEAVVYPVDLSAAFGTATIEFTFKKESDGAWRVVGMDISGI